jgi:hypothetical protein
VWLGRKWQLIVGRRFGSVNRAQPVVRLARVRLHDRRHNQDYKQA